MTWQVYTCCKEVEEKLRNICRLMGLNLCNQTKECIIAHTVIVGRCGLYSVWLLHHFNTSRLKSCQQEKLNLNVYKAIAPL